MIPAPSPCGEWLDGSVIPTLCDAFKKQENLGFALSKEFLQGIFISGSLKPNCLIYPGSQPSERNILLSFVNNLMHFYSLFWWLGLKLRIDLTGKLSS